jgi:hypothetical protein
MYVVGSTVVFTIERPRKVSPPAITRVRVVKPDGDIDNVDIPVSGQPYNTVPSSINIGLLSFSHEFLTTGLYKFEILSGTDPYVLEHSFYISAVSSDTTYNTTVDM